LQKKKNIILNFSLLFIVFLLFVSFITTSSKMIVVTSENYVTHGPIYIEYDSNFTDYSFPGTGTPGDPYRIENYNITVSSEYPILLGGDTTKHFVIQNCFLKTDTNIGIYLGKYHDIADGTVKILNNIIISENNIGIEMNGGKNSLISGNTFTCYGEGIMIYGPADFSIISNNDFYNADETGITIENSANITIIKNVNIGGWRGISLNNVADSIVTHNNCSDIDIGINLDTGDNLTLTNNRIINSSNTGIIIVNCDNSIFTNNLIQDSTNYAFRINSGANNILHHNAFIDNNEGGVQAYDSGSNNVWFESASLEGNYWSDWVSGSYSIDGTASSVDPYPLSSIPEIPEFSNILLIVFLFASVLIIPVVNLVYRKKR